MNTCFALSSSRSLRSRITCFALSSSRSLRSRISTKIVYVAMAIVVAGSTMAFPQSKKTVAPAGTAVTGIPYSPGVRAGDLLHVAGLMGTDTSGNIVTGGIEAQAKKTLENIGAVL